jgi:hypothetical protein
MKDFARLVWKFPACNGPETPLDQPLRERPANRYRRLEATGLGLRSTQAVQMSRILVGKRAPVERAVWINRLSPHPFR